MGDGVHFDLALAVAGLLVGFTVGLTGMGGGALMTPILVLLFRVQPLAAVSSDLVASFIMKPVGGGVHLRRGTVNFALVKWLMVGSVPAAFAGVLVLRRLGDGAVVQARVKEALGIALVAAASSIAAKALLQYRAARQARRRAPASTDQVRTAPAGGGAPAGEGAPAGDGAPALGHLLFGDFKLDLTASLLVGCLPGVYFGARVSSRARDGVIRPALAVILLASGLKLVDLGTPQLVVVMVAVVLLAVPLWGALDAISLPRHAWRAANVSRRTVVGVQSAGAPFGIGFVAALVYFGLLRPKLIARQPCP